jgi:death-on-curing protein
MAAAYAFHLCENHPFIDGNKRAALATALVFLEINGISILDPKHQLTEVVLKMAAGKLTKQALSNFLRKLPLE